MADDLDQSFTRIEQLARARGLPEVTRATSDGMPALTVRGSPFVHLRDAATLVLPCPSGQKSLLMEISPDIYFETDPYIGQPAVLIHLEVIADEELSLRLEDAWRFVAPSTLAARHPVDAPKGD